jgi:hypothetical protein
MTAAPAAGKRAPIPPGPGARQLARRPRAAALRCACNVLAGRRRR